MSGMSSSAAASQMLSDAVAALQTVRNAGDLEAKRDAKAEALRVLERSINHSEEVDAILKKVREDEGINTREDVWNTKYDTLITDLDNLRKKLDATPGGRRRRGKTAKKGRKTRKTRRGGDTSVIAPGTVTGRLRTSSASAPASPIPPGWIVTRVPKPMDKITKISPPEGWDGTLPDGVTKDSDGTYSMPRLNTSKVALANTGARRSKKTQRRRR